MPGFIIEEQRAAAAAEDQGTVVHVQDRTGAPMWWGEDDVEPVTITIAGRYSAKYRRAEENIRKRPIKRGKLTQDTFYEENTEKVVACTISWSGFLDKQKNPLPMTRENLMALYQGCPWVLDQVSEAMNDPGNFTNGSKAP